MDGKVERMRRGEWTYRQYGSDKGCIVTVTEWQNGDGVDVTLDGPMGHRAVPLTDDDAAALTAALSLFRLPQPKGEGVT
jgi:hypothetical protein